MTLSQIIKKLDELSDATHWVIPDEDICTVRELYRKLMAELEKIEKWENESE